jgi:hypothetical protein
MLSSDDSDTGFGFLDPTHKTFELMPVVFVGSFDPGAQERYGWLDIWSSSFHDPNKFGYEFPEYVSLFLG